MKKLQQLLPAICLLLFTLPAPASTTPGTSGPVPTPASTITIQDIIKLSPRQFEQKTGKKLRFKEKIAYKILKWKLKRKLRKDGEPTEQQKKLGTLSLIFGSIAVVSLLAGIGFLGIVALGSAIAGLILGLKSIKGNSNVAGLLGVIFSSGVLFIFILVVIALATFDWY